MSALISIIMPAYNVAEYISEAIQSVLGQSYTNWELLIVDNNSTDNTREEATKFIHDTRIQLLDEKRQGVGYARNKALEKIKGEFLCFLDADDVWPENSLASRMNIFEQFSDTSFVDGSVQYTNSQLQLLDKKYCPTFTGNPFDELLKLSSSCLFGNTWLIKIIPGQTYQFQTDMTHAEDLFFYLGIARNGTYRYTNDTILLYRQRSHSAMTDLAGLESGYIRLVAKIKEHFRIGPWKLIRLKLKITKIMILSFLFDGKNVLAAVRTPFKIWRS